LSQSKKSLRAAESILENLKNLKPFENRVESLKTLTERLLHERESLKEITSWVKTSTSVYRIRIIACEQE
jgi:pyruvate-formate lyase-activating enzyme